VLGIDVGWSAVRRSSGVCRLDWDGARIGWRLDRFRATEEDRAEAIGAAADRPLRAAAIDGPLARGFGPIGRYRACERMLTRRLGRMIGKPGPSNTPGGRLLNEQANACARTLRSLGAVAAAVFPERIDGQAIAEAFPSSFLGMMIAGEAPTVARRTRSDIFFVHLAASGMLHRLLAHLLPGRTLAGDPAAITDHDERAAFACALTALCLAAGRYTAVGDDGDGWIILPPRSLVNREIWAALALNELDDPIGALRSHE